MPPKDKPPSFKVPDFRPDLQQQVDGLSGQLQDLIRNHQHDGGNAQRINFNTDIIGLYETVTATPSGIPKSPYDQVKIYNGSLWIYDAVNNVWFPIAPNAGSTFVTSQFDKTNTTLANVTGLTFNVSAGVTYAFDAVLFLAANVTGGSKYAIAGTCTATSIAYNILLIDDTSNLNTITSLQSSLGGSAGQAGTTTGVAYISGTIKVNAAGTLTVQFAQNAANGTSSILIGSRFAVHQ